MTCCRSVSLTFDFGVSLWNVTDRNHPTSIIFVISHKGDDCKTIIPVLRIILNQLCLVKYVTTTEPVVMFLTVHFLLSSPPYVCKLMLLPRIVNIC